LLGIKNLLAGWNENTGKDKLADFVEQYWHFNNITAKTEAEFIDEYAIWAKERGYHQSQDKAAKIYALAKEDISTLPITQHQPKC